MNRFKPLILMITMAQAPFLFAADPAIYAYRSGNYAIAAKLFGEHEPTDPVVAYYMGRMHLYGYGQLKDNQQALREFTLAANKGYLPAAEILGSYALLVTHDPVAALQWFKQAATSNSLAANRYVAAAYAIGFGTQKNEDVAKRYYIAAARLGDAASQYAVAASFLDSRQLVNKKLGVIWLNKAVAQNLPIAQVRLAELYRNGAAGLPQDLNIAEASVRGALAQGYLPAQYELGEILLARHDIAGARLIFLEADKQNCPKAALALATLALTSNGNFYDPHAGFLWVLKAAQNGSIEAQRRLALMYKNGEGIEKNEQLAKEWQTRSQLTTRMTPEKAETAACLWLSNGKTTHFAATSYQLPGIFSQWHNPQAMQENQYNAAPQMAVLSKSMLYQPQFVMTLPNEIPLQEYYQAFVKSLGSINSSPIVFSRDPLVEALVESSADRLPQLENQALLGDSSAQVELGLRYQDGIGVNKNLTSAMRYYEMARLQDDLQAIYLSAVLMLESSDPVEQKAGFARLQDAALKGNAYAQYSLAQIYEQGYGSVPANRAEAIPMYQLAAVNNYGPAQYALAERMVRAQPTDLTSGGINERNALIKSLYEGAVENGITEAVVPLAFYQAMQPNTVNDAFIAAKQQADLGRKDAALLLGLMYDRGLGVAPDAGIAFSWYQKAGTNPISDFVRGTYLVRGIGAHKSVPEGIALLNRSLSSGFSYAQLNLSIVQHNTGAEFLPLLEKAVANGNTTAGILLADYYVTNATSPDLLKRARDIYQQFALQGDSVSALKLGYLFENGLGGSENITDAERYYRRAAEQDEPKAQYLLGRLYQLGLIGSQPDYIEAKKWYTKAQNKLPQASIARGFIAETVEDVDPKSFYQQALTHPVAQYNLGLVYEQGKWVAVDLIKARSLYQNAAQLGHYQAKQGLLRLKGKAQPA